VGLCFVDVSSQRRAFQLGILPSQPAQLADRLIPHFTQSPDQLIGLGGITFPIIGEWSHLLALCETRRGHWYKGNY
jgi:hypothetical protein